MSLHLIRCIRRSKWMAGRQSEWGQTAAWFCGRDIGFVISWRPHRRMGDKPDYAQPGSNLL